MAKHAVVVVVGTEHVRAQTQNIKKQNINGGGAHWICRLASGIIPSVLAETPIVGQASYIDRNNTQQIPNYSRLGQLSNDAPDPAGSDTVLVFS